MARSIGSYIGFNLQVEQEPHQHTSNTVSTFDLLMQSACNKTALPPKWNAINSKTQLKNDIVVWLSKSELGWEPSL